MQNNCIAWNVHTLTIQFLMLYCLLNYFVILYALADNGGVVYTHMRVQKDSTNMYLWVLWVFRFI